MFEEHLDMLVELGYVGLTIGQLTELTLAGRPVPERAVVVTFDDGFSDFASNAWPLMKARGVPPPSTSPRAWSAAAANGSNPWAPAGCPSWGPSTSVRFPTTAWRSVRTA